MKKLVIWVIGNNDVLFQEQLFMHDLPKIGETVIWMRREIVIKDIVHNFDEKSISVKVGFPDNSGKTLEARAILKENGLYTDNLWSISDVKARYNCTDQQAYDILDNALRNEATREQTLFAIDVYSNLIGLEKIEEKV